MNKVVPFFYTKKRGYVSNELENPANQTKKIMYKENKKMQNLWSQIQPHLLIIVANIATMTTIWATRAKKSEKEKTQQKYEKAHKNTLKAETKLHKAYEKEAALEKEMKNNVTSQ